MEIIKAAARHVSPSDRGKFLQLVADALAGSECGDGDVSRAVKLVLHVGGAMDAGMTHEAIIELAVIVASATLVGGGALALAAFVAERVM